MAKRRLDAADIKGEWLDWERRGRDDVTVDFMTIVGNVL
jgi:hypothetical protein